MNIQRKNKIIRLLNLWGNAGIFVKNYKMEFAEIMGICKNLKTLKALCYENKSVTSNAKMADIAEDSVSSSLEFYENRVSELNLKFNKNMKIRELIDNYVRELEPNEQAVLRARFVEQLKWEYVPAKLAVGCSLRQCYRIYDLALEKLNDMMDFSLFE